MTDKERILMCIVMRIIPALYAAGNYEENPHDYPMLYEIAREEVYGTGG